MAEKGIRPRKTPCSSCPYRRDVPSGVWAAGEYEKLRGYDGDTADQARAGAAGVFMCHQGAGEVCAGWAGVHGRDPGNFALRMAALLDPEIDIRAVREYETSVPLFASGAEAADHGEREIEHPSPEAVAVTEKVEQVRELRGKPVRRS